jgi:hypothetical protein
MASHLFAAQGCIGGGSSGEKLYGRKPLGVRGGDQIPVKSGVDAACGFAALNGVIQGSGTNERKIMAAVASSKLIKYFRISKTSSKKDHK